MARDIRDEVKGGSLSRQIQAVEGRLLRRRQSSALHTAALRRGLLARLTSPLGLLAAAAVGFAIDRVNLAGRVRRPVAASAGAASSFSLGSILQLLTMTASVVEMLQPTTVRPAPAPPAADA